MLMPHFRRTEPLVSQLLGYAAAEQPHRASAPPFTWRFEQADERQFHWVMEGGLGPLLYRATRDDPQTVPSTWRERLLSADLTAQVRRGQQVDTANEIIDCCAALGVPVTLLKGISTSEQFYPLPHLRAMADVDVLVRGEAREAVESALVQRGYRPLESHRHVEGFHHAAPLFHPGRQVWVEIHIKLFPDYDELGRCQLFDVTSVATESVPSQFGGRPVYRLRDELQLAYIATSWMRDISLSQIQPGFVHSLFDAIRLLVGRRKLLDWARLLGMLDSPLAAQSLHLMLAYLRRRQLFDAPRAVLDSLAARQGALHVFERIAIYAILDWYLIGGRYWNIAMPVPVPGRYYSARREPTPLPVV